MTTQPNPRSLAGEIARGLFELIAFGLFFSAIAVWWIIT
jgi:hypothetical protein